MAEMMNIEEVQSISFEIITSAGSATSKFMEAIEEAKDGNFAVIDELIKEGDELFVEAHHAHASLIEAEGNDVQIPFCLVLVHAEDQLMRAEMTKNISEIMIDLYKKLNK